MKHIPVIFQHQKCKAAGTEVLFLREVFLKKATESVQQLGSKKSEDLKAASIIHAKNRTNTGNSILDQYSLPLYLNIHRQEKKCNVSAITTFP